MAISSLPHDGDPNPADLLLTHSNERLTKSYNPLVRLTKSPWLAYSISSSQGGEAMNVAGSSSSYSHSSSSSSSSRSQLPFAPHK